MEIILPFVGLIGGLITLTAYGPQIIHLFRVKDSTGMSSYAWFAWLIGNLLLFVYAISILNWVYITMESLYVLSNLTIILLIYKYKKPRT